MYYKTELQTGNIYVNITVEWHSKQSRYLTCVVSDVSNGSREFNSRNIYWYNTEHSVTWSSLYTANIWDWHPLAAIKSQGTQRHVNDVVRKKKPARIRAHKRHLLQNQQVLHFLDQHCLLCIQKYKTSKVLLQSMDGIQVISPSHTYYGPSLGVFTLHSLFL